MKCKLCGNEYQVTVSEHCAEYNFMVMEQICFYCAFWRVKQQNKADPRQIVTDGNMYYIGDENASGRQSWRGFGGSKFVLVNIATGEVTVTTNLWHNGEIPEHFRAFFPDTHIRG